LTSLDILPVTLHRLECTENPIYTSYGFQLSEKTVEQYNEKFMYVPFVFRRDK